VTAVADIPLDLLLSWNEEVKRMVPKERLLVMDLKEGWEPLCNFLGVSIPNEPLPRVNDSAAAERVAKAIFARLLVIWLGILSATSLFLFAVWSLWASD
jgi:hypothetical protein